MASLNTVAVLANSNDSIQWCFIFSSICSQSLSDASNVTVAAFTWTHLIRIDFYPENKMIIYTPHSEYNYLFYIEFYAE